MPEYADSNGDRHTIAEYTGTSFRAIVANRALRRGEFVWRQQPQGWFPEFTCDFCEHPCYYNGVEGDHIAMQVHGGEDALWNLRLSCSTCNKGWAARMGPPAANTRSKHKHRRDDQIGH